MVVYNSILSVYITSGMDLTQVNEMYNCYFFDWEVSYLLSRVVTRPKNEHNPAAMTRDAITEMTALNANPHLLLTISILPAKIDILIF